MMTTAFLSEKITPFIPFEALYRINVHQDLDESLAYESLKRILEVPEERIRVSLLSILLHGIMVKGPKLEEVIGLLKAALSLDEVLENEKPTIILPDGEKIIGYAGSGKKGIKLINISTSSAILAASCGVHIAKACSHSTSSITGSSDFLSLVGIDDKNSFEKKEEMIRKTGIAFFSMEATTPKFAELYGGRFFVPHTLSFALAGLSIPLKVDVMLYGLAHPNVRLAVKVFGHFGFKNVMVISTTEDGIHYIDEIGVSGTLNVIGIKDGYLGNLALCPLLNELNLKKRYTLEDIKELNTPLKNVRAAIDTLRGRGKDAYTDAICANAGLLIYLVGKARSLQEGYNISRDQLMKGKAIERLVDLIKITTNDFSKLERFL